MNRRQLAHSIAQKHDVNMPAAYAMLDAVCNAIIAALQDGKKVSIARFGTFSPKTYAKRKGRNPSTGASLMYTPRGRTLFKQSTTFTL